MHRSRHRSTGGQIGRGRPDATISGNRKGMPSEALSVGRAEATRGGPNSRDMALGRTMGRIKGAPLGRELAVGKALGKRFAQGGHAFSDETMKRGGDRLKTAKKRDETLEEPAFKRGGRASSRGLKSLYKALHGPLEKEPYMKKLGAKKSNIEEGEPHRERAKGGRMWIAEATKNKGALHRSLGIPKHQKIPQKTLEKAEHSRSPLTRKRARLAETLRGFHH